MHFNINDETLREKKSSDGTKNWKAAIQTIKEAGSGDEIQLQAQKTERVRG